MNARTIAHNIDTKSVVENETFSIYRDDTTQNYTIFTGSLVESGAYILENGANITPEQVISASGRVYRRIYLLERRDDSPILQKLLNFKKKIQSFFNYS